MKLKYTLVFSIISFFITTTGFAQALSDQEIGLDVTKIELKLKKRGYKELDIAEIISGFRKEYIIVHTEKQKQIQIELQKQIKNTQLEQLQLKNKAINKSTVATVPLEERNALIAFYNAAGGSNWENTINNDGAWPVNDPNATVESYDYDNKTGWYGVTVTDGHVTSLNLKGYFRNQKDLNLNGSISDLSALTQLSILNLRFVKLSGNLNGLQNLVNLKELVLYRNSNVYNEPAQPDLESIIPVCNLRNLKKLHMGNCTFVSKKIPLEIRGLTNLNNLYIGSDFTSGLEEIGYLRNLENLFIQADNKFSGAIPDSFSNLQNLKSITIYANSINDMSVLGSITGLKLISLEQNDISTIPSSFANLTNLAFLNLFMNDIEKVPSFCSNFPLNYFSISYNRLAKDKLPALNFTTPSISHELFDNASLFYDGKTLRIEGNSFRFVDFENEFSNYKNTIRTLWYNEQSKVDKFKIETKTAGQSVTLTMYEDTNRYTTSETFQWFKGIYPSGVAVNPTSLSTNRELVISNLTLSHAGDYYCVSKHPQIPYLELVRERITLNVLRCPTQVTGELRSSTELLTVNSNATFSLNTAATGLTYKWTFYNNSSGTVIKDDSQTTATATQSYSQAGSYLVRLEVIENNGCTTTFNKVINVINNCVNDSYSPNRNGSINSPYPYGDWSGVILNKLTNLSFYSSSGSTRLSYQWSLFDSNNALVASGNQAIFPITLTLAGDYKVVLRVSDAMGCSSFERDLKTRESTPCIIPISDRGGYIINSAYSEKLLVNTATVLSLNRSSSYTTAGFTYKWDLVKQNGDLVFSGIDENFTVTPTEIGDYIVNLQIKDPNGCTTDYTREYKVMDICGFTADDEQFSIATSGEYNLSNTYFVQINETKDFSLGSPYEVNSDNYTFKWTLFNPSGELVSTSTSTIFSSAFTIPGYYRIVLELTNKTTGCIRVSTKEVGCLIGNSCTELNPKSAMVKDLLKNLIKSLIMRSIKGETDAQINASSSSPEFLALKPYITNGTGNTIYNYKYSKSLGNSARPYSETIDFSFSPERSSDIHLDFYWGVSGYVDLTDEEILNRLENDIFIDMSQYVSSNNYFTSCRVDMAGKNAQSIIRPSECKESSEVRYIDFCPTDCKPVEGTLSASTVTPFINTSTKFSFDTIETNLTYHWTVTNAANQILDSTSNGTRFYSFIGSALGNYTISLKIVDEKNCTTELTKSISVVPLPTVNGCSTHFNFNFKVPDNKPVYGGISLDLEARKNLARGVAGFLSQNINKKLFITSFDDSSGGARLLKNNSEVVSNLGTIMNNGTFEVYDDVTRYIRLQDDNYNNTFSTISNSLAGNAQISNIDVSFFIISDDKFNDINSVKTAYQNLINSAKAKKIFFVLVKEGQFKNTTLNSVMSPIEFITQLKGSAPIDFASTNSIYSSDYVMFSKAQVADVGFETVLTRFLEQSYDETKRKKCVTAGCVVSNTNSQVVKGLFISLINKLQSLPKGTITNGYTCSELIALIPYITVKNPAIYNYNQGSFSFSNQLNNNDVFMGADAQVSDINLESYVDSDTETNFIAKHGSLEKGGSVKHINFCPESLCLAIEGTIKYTPQVLNANVVANFSLETAASNLTYDWTFYNLDNTTVLAK
ncbi:PKD domain-containing protein, partial [Flavobacterium polysaccharolyticum]